MAAIEGPRGPIAYERDELGYPKIAVRDELEGAWARGYFHALDRLVQVRLTQAISQGRMMEMLGDQPMSRAVDRLVRTLDFTSDVDERIAQLTSETRTWLESYCAGFAAGEKARGRPWPLRLLGLKPTAYAPRDIITVYRLVAFFGLTSLQLSAELLIAELIQRKTPRRTLDLLLGEAAAGLDLEALDGFQLDPELQFLSGHLRRGSNAFAVAAERSKSGGALLMGEFHMEVGKFPPGLYALHLDYADGGTLQGMSIPGFAWISAARTAHVGWSYTFAHADNVDLRIPTETPKSVERTETVKIRGKPSETWVFRANEHGVQVGAPNASTNIPHLRWSGLREIHRDLEACRKTREAKTVEELVELHREMVSISLEGVFADADGRVAVVNTGQVDERDGGWTGAYPAHVTEPPRKVSEEKRPVSIDPAEAFVASANQASPWTTLPEPRYRHERLRQILSGLKNATLSDMVAASYDDRDLCMERLVPVWTPLLPASVKLDPGLFHALHDEVVAVLLARDLGDAAVERFTKDLGATLLFEHHLDCALALERPELLNESELSEALHLALPKARAHAKPHPLRARYKNVVTQGKEPLFLGMSGPEIAIPGGPTQLFQSRQVHFLGQDMLFGPAFHFTFDMSQPGGWYHLPGGASERRFGPGYGRGVDLWQTGCFLPLGNPQGDAPRLRK